MFTMILVALLIGLWAAYSRLKHRVEILEARLDTFGPAPAFAAAPAGTAPAAVTRMPPPSVPVAEPVKPAAPRPAAPPAVKREPITPVPERVVEPAAAAPAAVPRAATVTAASSAQVPADTWEVVVGTSWLNKLGVLVFVIGVALLVGYSMTQLGPAGRVAIGFAISAAMLGTGVVLERRPVYRNYAYGLVAGGWAGAYFTAYAMHALPAARIVNSAFAGTTFLVAIAAGMIAHSLRYRSQTVTALAYVVAYATLALTPLSGYSLVASVPLAMSLLVVALRLGWSDMSSLGLVSTYAIFMLRGRLFVPGEPEAGTTLPFLVLAAYWLTFEVADILARRTYTSSRTAPLFALNAVAFLGSGILQLPLGRPDVLWLFLASTASAYLASAIVRSAVLDSSVNASGESRFTTTHGALAITAGLVAWAIDVRLARSPETFALLVETQLLVVAGIALNDRMIRRIGSVVAIVVTWHGLLAALNGSSAASSGLSASSAALAMSALAWYGNREWLRARSLVPDWLERGYTWTATILTCAVVVFEVAPIRVGLVLFIVAAVLLEAGLRRAKEYRLQAYAVGVLATLAIGVRFVSIPNVAIVEVWTVLPASIAIACGAAIRLARRAIDADDRAELRLAASTAATIAAGLIMTLQWQIVPAPLVAAAWAMTALASVAVGVSRPLALCRWHGYVLAWFAAWLAIIRLGANLDSAVWPSAVVVGAIYAAAVVSHRLSHQGSADATPTAEAVAHALLGMAGTFTLVVLEWRVAAAAHLGGLWALTAFGLLMAGIVSGRANVRWQSYVLLLFGSASSLGVVLEPGAAPVATLVWISFDIVALHAASLVSRSVTRAAGAGADIETACCLGLSLAGTLVMAVTIFAEMPATMITLSWGLGGLLLLLAGFPARERVLRLSGLALLFLCLIKLFVSDLGQLDPWPRIISFVVLGLVLLAVSWIYTRLRERVQRFL